MYKITSEPPPVRLRISEALKELSIGNDCLVFNYSQRLTVANTVVRLKNKGLKFTCKRDGNKLKVWRLNP